LELSILPERDGEADITAPARQNEPWLKRNRSRQHTALLRQKFFAAAALITLLPFGQATALAQEPQSPQKDTPQTKSDETEIPLQPTETPVAPSTPVPPKVVIPNFTSCTIPKLQKFIPDLKRLQPSGDQTELTAILDKIGANTVEIVRKTPNLISHESVVTEQRGIKTLQNYSYLILTHPGDANSAVLEEFRVDLATGAKLEASQITKDADANSRAESSSLELPSPSRSVLASGGAPASQGFGTAWLNFYPLNRALSEFRYLGQQKMDGHATLVVAFAQKPASVKLPAKLFFENRTVPLFMQGVAWVDASDFRIVRLRTDLLAPPSGVDLSQLTADIHFSQVQIAGSAAPLWLIRDVTVTSDIGGATHREIHVYSKYRLFRARTKILLSP
jgi:hypothetical protein